MPIYISLLRGINVSGQKKIKMDELRQVYEAADCRNVTTYIQSGNVVFNHALTDPVKMAKTIESNIAKQFGYPVTVFLREKNELAHIIKINPFLKRKNLDLQKLHVTFLDNSARDIQLGDVGEVNSGRDEFEIIGTETFIHCPEGYGRTKLTNNFFERKLGIAATTRNWRTVNKLYEIAQKTLTG